MPQTLTLATRGSRLAVTQSEWVAARLQAAHPGLEVRLEIVKSEGDADRTSALSQIGGKGLFTRAVDEALLSGAADFAVHSLKDLPTQMLPGLALAAVPAREDAHDVLAGCDCADLSALPQGATVATGSPRRRAQLLLRRPDLQIVEIRGNVETRLATVREKGYAGTVLAAAGLNRLEIRDTPFLSLAGEMLPAVGQGALGVVCRADDERTAALLSALECPATRACVCAERAFLRTMEAGCHAPVGTQTLILKGILEIVAAVFAVDGSREIRAVAQGLPAEAEDLGRRVAAEIRDEGGDALLNHPA